MSSQELLLMLVLNIFNDEETTNVVDEGVFILGVIVDSLLILSIVTD
jgi:hypothetical protein